jgi:hypothetical protein
MIFTIFSRCRRPDPAFRSTEGFDGVVGFSGRSGSTARAAGDQRALGASLEVAHSGPALRFRNTPLPIINLMGVPIRLRNSDSNSFPMAVSILYYLPCAFETF